MIHKLGSTDDIEHTEFIVEETENDNRKRRHKMRDNIQR